MPNPRKSAADEYLSTDFEPVVSPSKTDFGEDLMRLLPSELQNFIQDVYDSDFKTFGYRRHLVFYQKSKVIK